ncbi:MAG: DUF5666 domain-containing protein [Fimbriimonadales bacterium]
MKLRPIVLAAAILLAGFASAESLLTSAKVIKVTERGLILQVGTEPLAVEDSTTTKYWRGRAVGKREAYVPGENVMARINTKEDPPELKEIADEASWKWLDGIRKHPQKGTVEKLDSKFLTVRLVDGTAFSYRATDKTDVTLKGKSSRLSDLEVGATVWVKGRTLPTLDTWAVTVTDEPIPDKAAKTSKEPSEAKPKMKPLEASGVVEGELVGHHPELKMLDLDQGGRTLHVTYSNSTVFFLDGKPARPTDVQIQQHVRATYKRDKSGRILASRVELSSS